MKSGFGSIQNTITNIFFLVLFTSCTENKEQIQNRKTVDSLSGVLSTVISVSSKTDSVQLNKALLKFNNYNQFVKRIVKDTFSKADADCLQQFYKSGKNLMAFTENREAVLSRARMVQNQLSKLSEDLKNEVLNPNYEQRFLNEEKKQIEVLLTLSQQETNLFSSSLEEFKLSIKCAEELIRQRNKGQLPNVIENKSDL